jgi:hypothetical protein
MAAATTSATSSKKYRTVVGISRPWSEESLNEEMSWDDHDEELIMRLRKSLAQSLVVGANEGLPRILFVQQKGADGELESVPVEELKRIIMRPSTVIRLFPEVVFKIPELLLVFIKELPGDCFDIKSFIMLGLFIIQIITDLRSHPKISG